MSPLPKKIRLALYVFFLLGFFISAPVVVLYTAGYRYSFGVNRVVQTGVLSVKSVPKGARIFIDGEPQRAVSPAVIKNVLPGEHTIRLEKDGYTAWEKQLSINSRDTTFVANATLFLKTPAEQVRDIEPTTYAVEPGSRRIAYIREEADWNELWLFDPNANTERLLARHPKRNNADIRIEWSADGTYLALIQSNAPTDAISLIRTNDGFTRSLGSFVEAPNEMWWDSEDGQRLFVRTEEGLIVLNIADETQERLSRSVRAGTHKDGRLLVTQEGDQQIVVGILQENTSTILAYLPLGTYRFRAAPDGLILLEDIRRSRIVLLDMEAREQPILLNTAANQWDWERDGDARLLYSDGFDLHVYNPQAHRDMTLTRLSHPIQDVSWYRNGAVVFYAREDGLFAIELDGRDRRNIVSLVEQADVQRVWMDMDEQNVYMLANIDDAPGIYRRRLQR